ncbi:hypothetical protein [Serratia marcescens]|uniref:hypothetical protein n=1 Tax=Serratia marcescens TaxID=615 RepID=UPI000A95268E|nr:hypothetical protein [Serratia marcescens]MDP8626912.1 hypothetical protein [Serratia marcescens]MDP8676346.1 hypothetical protein [Serratia marcescens]MDP8691349.1 hypothetical protein [Serratia marcescens]MDP8701006.1 hypothetical protein [Serratia marcescens]MDP8710772.1 hypothetical protein [Serratia marcescens]
MWWLVLISGFSAYARQWQNMATGVQSLRISLRIHHNANDTHRPLTSRNNPGLPTEMPLALRSKKPPQQLKSH